MLAVAVTGILATMPYIALQLVGIQAVVETMGLGGGDNIIAKDLPLFIAFAVLAASAGNDRTRTRDYHVEATDRVDRPSTHVS